jgi:hypothetical protein
MAAVIKMDMNDINRSVNLAKSVQDNKKPFTKSMLKILELKLFVMKKIQNNSNCTILVPALKKKLNDLSCEFLEGIEKEMEKKLINEGAYLSVSNIIKSWHQDVTQMLDLLESGLVIKCVIT